MLLAVTAAMLLAVTAAILLAMTAAMLERCVQVYDEDTVTSLV